MPIRYLISAVLASAASALIVTVGWPGLVAVLVLVGIAYALKRPILGFGGVAVLVAIIVGVALNAGFSGGASSTAGLVGLITGAVAFHLLRMATEAAILAAAEENDEEVIVDA